ncbi:sensor histidine kinase [Brevirhabdus pacifica]|uniref:sensor histidine kinase n=1 Tax=Brevirhabdus pacifica TaxID=1267768 RepID=UPI0012FD72EE|nr:sensor histidine kinase [Brevirhabdus pacifica]
MTKRLGFRVMAFLSLALLPLGLIAVVQTRTLTQEVETRTQLTLLALTREAAADDRQLIQRALGAGRAMSGMFELLTTPEQCRRYLSDYVSRESDFVWAGFIPADGQVSCASDGIARDLSDRRQMADLFATDLAKVLLLDQDGNNENIQPVVTVNYPVYTREGLEGFVTIALPLDSIQTTSSPLIASEQAEFFTINAAGDVLVSQEGSVSPEQRLPPKQQLTEFLKVRASAFSARTVEGRERTFAVVPILANSVFAIGSWEAGYSAATESESIRIPPAAFPLLMWLSSLAVAYFAVHWLVIRHIRSLRLRMSSFAKTRRVLQPPAPVSMPAELQEMEDSFIYMTDTILKDEAELENAVREQKVLLKEVYHRVKNNLQLIASIMNMQMRQLKSEEARSVLRRVQERVLSLATVHRNLYQNDTLAQIRGDLLLKEIVNQRLDTAVASGTEIDVTISMEPFELYPDQAVPLSLLATEAITNALKYIGRPPDGLPWLRVELVVGNDGDLTLAIENSIGAPLVEPAPVSSGGLGARLIAAFSQQLLGEVQVEERKRSYGIVLRFNVREFDEYQREK